MVSNERTDLAHRPPEYLMPSAQCVCRRNVEDVSWLQVCFSVDIRGSSGAEEPWFAFEPTSLMTHNTMSLNEISGDTSCRRDDIVDPRHRTRTACTRRPWLDRNRGGGDLKSRPWVSSSDASRGGIENDHLDPAESLERILRNQAIGQMSQMELTYLPVLDHLTTRPRDREQGERLLHDFRAVVGSIVLLAEPLSVNSLATLLDVPIPLISRRLAQLHSALSVSADHHTPVRMLHLSFAEFLLSDEARKHPFSIDGPSTHLTLSRQCLRVLSGANGLRENICDLDYPGQPRHEVESTRITSRLSPVVQYACRYWVYHVQCSAQPIHDLDGVHTFLKEHFLHWLEALSLIDRLSEAIRLVTSLQSCVSITADQVRAFLHDARRFILAHRHVIDLAPIQLYSSAIIFTPENSVVQRACGQVPPWIRQCPRAVSEWGLEHQTLEGHSSRVTSVAFSPDGSLLASASWDRTVRV